MVMNHYECTGKDTLPRHIYIYIYPIITYQPLYLPVAVTCVRTSGSCPVKRLCDRSISLTLALSEKPAKPVESSVARAQYMHDVSQQQHAA
jgi:hypothetical protein